MTASRSSARQRILDVATSLFYREGIHTVGVDTIVEQSGVGKATLYRHFPTKDLLIAAYLEQQDQLFWKRFEEAIAEHEMSPREQLVRLLEITGEIVGDPNYRGCAFLNALAEFAHVDHPAHQQAVEHKRLLRQRLCHLSQQAGASDPDELAGHLLLLINGTLASVPVFQTAELEAQLKTLATSIIDRHLASTQKDERTQ